MIRDEDERKTEKDPFVKVTEAGRFQKIKLLHSCLEENGECNEKRRIGERAMGRGEKREKEGGE